MENIYKVTTQEGVPEVINIFYTQEDLVHHEHARQY